MKKLFIATIEFEIPIEAESAEEAYHYLEQNCSKIDRDFPLIDCISPFGINEINYETGVDDPDTLVYNTDEELSIQDWKDKYCPEEEKQAAKQKWENLKKYLQKE